MAALDLRAGLFLDGTFGAGGYTRAILSTPGTRVVALDRDPTAIASGQSLVREAADRLTLVEDRFANLADVVTRLDLGPLAGVALDIGVSSMQIDEAERGFSFRADGPLDMRMSTSGRSAADIVNEAPEETLADILYYFGEERLSRRIAKAIVLDRQTRPFLTTRPLAEMIARVAPGKPTDIHPATRTFQALRIAVNDELGELVAGLAAAERVLAPGGRLAVVTFHSLEDRIVKQFLARRAGKGEAPGRRLPGEPAPVTPSFTLPKGQPITPSAAEARANPRSRSAKLRVGGPDGRTAAAPRCRSDQPRATAPDAGTVAIGKTQMIRLLNFIAIAALIGSAIYAYSIKYKTMFHAETVAGLKLEIKKERDQIGQLRADWAHLTRPERVQELSDKLLDLQPLALTQIVKVDALPEKAPSIDIIGRKLEDLGLSEPTNTPATSSENSATPTSSKKAKP